MKIKINAIDTLFFKDGKPFSMGDETWADGIFPPPPSVIYGALRSAYFGENPGEFSKANHEGDPTKNLKILRINYLIGSEHYFPIPLDFVKKKNENEEKAYLMKNNRNISLSSSSFDENFLAPEFKDEVESADGGIISKSSLDRYLNGKETEFYYSTLSNYIQSEPKVGIGRDNFTRSTSEGKLYRVGMRRLAEVKEYGKDSNELSLCVEFEGITLKESGFLKLGAEGKVARYQVLAENNETIKNEEVISNNEIIFKLYLVTPALFKNGWKPDIDNNLLFKDLGLEIVSVCIGKPQNYGGFDMQKKMPKPMRKAVPAGSVYYFKSTQKSFNSIFSQLNGKSISDFNQDEGFGISLIGEVK